MSSANGCYRQAVSFVGYAIVFVAHAEIQRERRRHFPVILEEYVPVVLVRLRNLSVAWNGIVVLPLQIFRLLEEVILKHLTDGSGLKVEKEFAVA